MSPDDTHVNLWRRIICFVRGHRYYVIKEFDWYNRKVGCRRCRRAWGMNDWVRAFIPWDQELEDLYYDQW